jgi:hypothetical protein
VRGLSVAWPRSGLTSCLDLFSPLGTTQESAHLLDTVLAPHSPALDANPVSPPDKGAG